MGTTARALAKTFWWSVVLAVVLIGGAVGVLLAPGTPGDVDGQGMAAVSLLMFGVPAALVALATGLVWLVERRRARLVLAQAAWHPDRTDNTRLRWWDGATWTENTATRAGASMALTSDGRLIDPGQPTNRGSV